MNIRHLITILACVSLAAAAHAGLVQPAPVDVELDNQIANGDMLTARTSSNSVEFIGCGVRQFDDGINEFAFGFCQAGDADENQITCFTQTPSLLETIRAISDNSFVTFSWRDDGQGGAECVRVGFSTQSFYLPDEFPGGGRP